MKPQHSLYSQRAQRLFTLAALVFCSSLGASAQEETSQYDRGTPPQHGAGVSALGSYISTDLGTVNLSNGSLNFALPLAQVGGRGFSLPLTLNYSSKVWSASIGVDIVLDPTYQTYPAAIAAYDSLEGGPDLYQRVAPGWTFGGVPLLRVRGVGISSVENPSCGAADYLKALTKLTLILPDKGEVELRDDSTDGSPLSALALSPTTCRWVDGNRGQRWHSTDGSGIVFISDATNGVVNGNLNGWLIASDGTRYRFTDTSAPFGGSVFLNEFARATSITDRNGNRVQIAYSTNPLAVTYTDQLGRTTTIQYGVTDPGTGETLALLVTVPGYNGQSRQYKVKTGVMNQNYRAGIDPTLPVYNGAAAAMGGFCGSSPPSGTYLFDSWCGGSERIDNRSVLTQLLLPDNRALKFRYNEFGEVAQVELPTEGTVQYDYAYENGMPSGNSALFEVHPVGPGNVAAIDRAVVARRTYPDGVNVEAHWSYAYTATPGLNGAASNGVAEVIARASDNSTVLSREKHYFLNAARFLTSDGGTGYSLWSTGLERRSEALNAAGSATISASELDWLQRTPIVWSYGYVTEQTQNDNRVNEERQILETGQTARTTTIYDLFNNPIETNQFDFDNALKRRTVTSYSSNNLVNGGNYAADAIRLIRLPLQQSVFDGAGVEQARTITEYDIYTGDGNHELMQVYGLASGHDTANYGPTKTTRGNATRLGNWIKSSNSYLYTYPRFDMLGNLVSAKDARGNVSTTSFADDFGDGSNPGSGTNNPATPTYGLPTLITSPPPTAGAPVHTARSQYDLSTGLQTGFKDRNGAITQTLYADPFNRPTQIKAALGTGVETHAAMYYAPATVLGIALTKNDALTTKDQTNVNDETLRSWTVTDGFGRTRETWGRDPQGDTRVLTNYDGLGRVRQQSNPFRPSLGESAIYTTTVYDLGGRVTTVTTPDSAVVATSYSGNTITVTDQAGKARRTVTDGLGRLKEVYEDPTGLNYLTTYAYDVLDNLITVNQGSQTRTFVYDSLKRLTSATNPESGTITYLHDANGNLTQKTDARSIVTTYVYDALNRNVTVDYSNTSGINPDITRIYDTATNGKGRLRESYAGGTETVGATVEHTKILTYDALGRPLDQRQRFKTAGIWSVDYQTQRVYNRAGGVTSQIYPSGRSVAYAQDTAGRPNNFTGNLGDGTTRTYSTGILYSPLGGVTKEQFGTDTPLFNKSFYNSRGQLSEIRVSTSYTGPTDTTWNRGALINHYSLACWGMCGGSGSTTAMTDNNGNLKKQDVYIPLNEQVTSYTMWTDQFDYDNLNRLQRVKELNSGSVILWQQEYVNDRWGNRTIHQTNTWGAGINDKNFTVNTANNRLGVPGGQTGTMTYDSAGNLTTDTYSGAGVARAYDAENHMTSETQASSYLAGVYTYNADGQRVRRKVASVETWQVYGLEGELLAEYAANEAVVSPHKEYGYRNGQLLITAELPGAQNVVWQNAVGVSVAGNSLTKTATTAWGNGGAASTQSIVSGDGYVEFTATETNKDRVCGLSNGDTNQNWTDIDFGLYMRADGKASIVEFGVYYSAINVPIATGDLLRVSSEGGVVKYKKNGTVFHTSNATAIYPLRVDTAFYTTASTLSNVVISGNLGSGGSANINWLVADQLGTPRIVFDKTGTFANVKRHDYLPFGEELFAGTGGRTAGQGYSQVDGHRKQWATYERDDETGLDYAQARFYSSTTGRFTSPDPTLLSVNALSPQSWNRYTYVLNNPLLYVDPLGLWEIHYQNLYKSKKNKDGSETKVFDRRAVYARKSKDGDDGASLAKQLGLTENEAEKFAAQVGGSDNLRLAEQGGDVGRVFNAVEQGLSEQAKWEAKNAGKLDALAAKGEYGPSHTDCSRSACQIGLGLFQLQVGTNVLDTLLDTEAKAVAGSNARVGDIIRYAKENNVATHFANYIFRNDDGTPVAFSKSGITGRYEVRTAASLQVPIYGTTRGKSGADSGYYRKR